MNGISVNWHQEARLFFFNCVTTLTIIMHFSWLFLEESRDISLGQGKEVHARRLLQQFMTEGGWYVRGRIEIYAKSAYQSISFLTNFDQKG